MAPHRLLALVIVVATAAFAVGISLETSDTHTEAEAGHVEGEESEAAEAGHVEGETPGAGGELNSESENEELLGIDLESSPLVVLAVIASLALAAAALAVKLQTSAEGARPV